MAEFFERHLQVTVLHGKFQQKNNKMFIYVNALPLLWSQKVVSFPKIKSCPSLVTTALLPLLQAAYTTSLVSNRIIFLGLTAFGCLLAFALQKKIVLFQIPVDLYKHNPLFDFCFTTDF